MNKINTLSDDLFPNCVIHLYYFLVLVDDKYLAVYVGVDFARRVLLYDKDDLVLLSKNMSICTSGVAIPFEVFFPAGMFICTSTCGPFFINKYFR